MVDVFLLDGAGVTVVDGGSPVGPDSLPSIKTPPLESPAGVSEANRVDEIIEHIRYATFEDPKTVTFNDSYGTPGNPDNAGFGRSHIGLTGEGEEVEILNLDRSWVGNVVLYDPDSKAMIFTTARHCVVGADIPMEDSSISMNQYYPPEVISLSDIRESVDLTRLVGKDPEWFYIYLTSEEAASLGIDGLEKDFDLTASGLYGGDIAFVANRQGLATLHNELQMRVADGTMRFDTASLDAAIGDKIEEGRVPAFELVTTRNTTLGDIPELRARSFSRFVHGTAIGVRGGEVVTLVPYNLRDDSRDANSLAPGASGSGGTLVVSNGGPGIYNQNFSLLNVDTVQTAGIASSPGDDETTIEKTRNYLLYDEELLGRAISMGMGGNVSLEEFNAILAERDNFPLNDYLDEQGYVTPEGDNAMSQLNKRVYDLAFQAAQQIAQHYSIELHSVMTPDLLQALADKTYKIMQSLGIEHEHD